MGKCKTNQRVLTPEERRIAYTQALAQVGAPGLAAKAVLALQGDDPQLSVDPDSTYRVWRREDPAFRAACEDARLTFVENVLEPEAIRRAVQGVAEPIFNKDSEQIGERIRYSDTLMRDLLRRNDRLNWGPKVEQMVNVTEQKHVTIDHKVTLRVPSMESLDTEQRKRLVTMYRAQLPAPQRESITDGEIELILARELSPDTEKAHASS